jgi:hypothetical protein
MPKDHNEGLYYEPEEVFACDVSREVIHNWLSNKLAAVEEDLLSE